MPQNHLSGPDIHTRPRHRNPCNGTNWAEPERYQLHHNCMRRSVNAGLTEVLSNHGALTNAWSGGVLAANGNIYGIPTGTTNVLKIDPSTDTVSTFTHNVDTLASRTGGVLAANGKIYAFPFSGSKVLKIDPDTDTASSAGTINTGYAGSVLGPNNIIYGIPHTATAVARFDPSDDSLTYIGTTPGQNDWLGGVLATNGNIYGIPWLTTAVQAAKAVLKIDPLTDTLSTFGETDLATMPTNSTWNGGVLAPNRMIYAAPSDYRSSSTTSILKIDPINETVSFIGGVGPKAVYYGGVLAPNGKIYFMPGFNAETREVLVLDPSDDTFTTIGDATSVPFSNKYAGASLANNGSVYGIPNGIASVLKIDPGAAAFPSDLPLSNLFNKL